MEEKYGLKITQPVRFKCKVVEIKDNCVVRVKGVNVGDKNIEFDTHPNSLALDTFEDKILMPEALTAENGAKALLAGEFFEGIELECPKCEGGRKTDGSEYDCIACGGSGVYIEKIPVRWAIIKAIYGKVVQHLGKKPI